MFERSAETLGPIFLERPQTLGQGKFNINLSWQYVEYNEFDGQSLRNLHGNGPIVLRNVDASGNLLGFEADNLQYRLGLRNNIVAFSFTYGILDNLDVNLLMPIITTALDVGVTKQQVQTAGPDGVFAPDRLSPVSGFTSGTAFGPGDLLLRLKYQLPQLDWFQSAAGLQMRFPTGRAADFQGTGDFWMTPAFYASTLLWNRVEPFVNLAIDFDANDFKQSQARYGAGVDVDIVSQFGLVFAFLGRSQFEDPVNPATTDFLYLTPHGRAAPAAPRPRPRPQGLLRLLLRLPRRGLAQRDALRQRHLRAEQPGSAQRHRDPDGGGRGHLLGRRSRCTGRSSAWARRPSASRPIRASCTTTPW